MPGYKHEDIEVNLEGDSLVVTSRKQVETEGDEQQQDTGATWHFKERKTGYSKRTFHLPATADKSSIEAEYVHGTVKVVVGKKLSNALPKH